MIDRQTQVSERIQKSKGWVGGVLGAVSGALLTGLVTVGTQSSLQKQNAQLERQLEEQKEQFQKQLADAIATAQSESQQANIQAEVKLHHDDAEAAADLAAQQRLIQHFQNVHAEYQNLKDQVWWIQFKNECDELAHVAVHYEAIDSMWVTEGWFSIPPGETVSTRATRNRDVCWHATSAHHDWSVWKDGEDFNSLQEANHEFTQLQDDRFIGGSESVAKYYKYRITQTDWTPPIIPIVCPKAVN